MRRFLPGSRDGRGARGFTLIELIFVMVLLAIGIAFVAPFITSFFRGRVLNSEARRMLALIHYGQSRAVAEGMPVLMWVNAHDGTYGLSIQTGFVDVDEKSSSFTVNPALTLEAPAANPEPVSELQDEKLGIPDNLAVLRFLPDGFCDEGSAPKIVIHQGTEGALEIVRTENRLGYEILPYIAPS